MADAGLRLTVDGEREFKKAISEINDLLKVNSSELRLLSEQYKSSDKSLETMTGKQKTLSEAMDLQSQKIAEIEKQLSDAEKIYGKTGARTLELTVQYNNARTALTKLTTEYNAVTEEIKRTEDAEADFNKRLTESSDRIDKIKNPTKRAKAETKELRDAVRELTEKYGANNTAVRKHTEELKNAEKQLNKTEDATEDLSEANDGGKLSLDGLFKSGGDVSDLFGDLQDLVGNKLTSAIGTELPAAVGKFGTAASSFASYIAPIAAAAGIVGKMWKAMDSAGDSAGDFLKQAAKFGVGSEEMQAFIYGMQKSGYTAEDAGQALSALQSKLSPLINELVELGGNTTDLSGKTEEEKKRIYELREELNDYGVQIFDTNGDVRSIIDIFNDYIIAMRDMYTYQKRQNQLQEVFGDSMGAVSDIIANGPEQFIAYQKEAIATGAVLEDYLSRSVDNLTKKIDFLKESANNAKTGLGTMIYSWLTGDFGGVKDSWDYIISNIKSGLGIKTKGYASGTDFYPGGLSLVGEYGPEIVQLPRGTKIYPNGTAPNLGTAENNTYNISINARDVREFNDIVKMAQSARVRARMR